MACCCGRWCLVRLRSSGRGEGTVAAWCGGGSGTLLGPEGTAGWLLSRGRAPGRVPCVGSGSGVVAFGSSLVAYRVAFGWRLAGWVWRVGRCLRTAQWTRASL